MMASTLPCYIVTGLIAGVLLLAIGQQTAGYSDSDTKQMVDHLPSWNDGPAKQSIIQFVKSATDKNSPQYVPSEDRIAVFDNDGTLWTEQPIYFQLAFAIDRVKALAPQHPEWKEKQPFKAILENDTTYLPKVTMKDVVQIVMITHTGITTDEFRSIVCDWIANAKHPRFKRPYTDLVYQPMLELMTYLRANGFKTYIVSGGTTDFMRPWVDDIYGIPPEQVVGSSFVTQYEMQNGKQYLKILPKVDFIDDKAGKPVGIHKFIGRRPVMAVGNSDGDLQMLQWTSDSKYANLRLLIHHTDKEREYAYDKGAEKVLKAARKNGWTVVDMKEDWRVIYPFQARK
jgi:phosphoserine phosphatase